jgi:hypothetical protein
MLSLARWVGVTNKWAEKVIDELTATSQLENPDIAKHTQNVSHGVSLDFTLEEEVFLLALQIECLYHSNMEYVAKLKDCYMTETYLHLRFQSGSGTVRLRRYLYGPKFGTH